MSAHQRKETVQSVPILITWEEGKRIVGAKTNATMQRFIDNGFPTAIEVGPRRINGAVGKRMFVKSEVDAWLAARIAERDTACQPA